MFRVLHIHRTCSRCTRHSRARTCRSPSRGPLFVHLDTADRACCAPREALCAGKQVYRRDYCGTNVTCTVYGVLKLTGRHLKLMCPLLTCRCPGVSQKRDGCGTAPYVTCRFAYYVYETDIVLAAWIYVLLLFAFMQVAVLGLQTSFGPAFFLPQRVRYSIQSDPRLTQLLGVDLSDGFLCVGSSLIH